MLVLARKKDGRIFIDHAGERLFIKVTEIESDRVRLGFEGPREFVIIRAELDEHGKGVPNQ